MLLFNMLWLPGGGHSPQLTHLSKFPANREKYREFKLFSGAFYEEMLREASLQAAFRA